MAFRQLTQFKLISLCMVSAVFYLHADFAKAETQDLVKDLTTTEETTLDGFLQKNAARPDDRTFEYSYEDDIREFSSIRFPLSRSLQAAKSSVETPRIVSVIPAKYLGDPPSFLGFIKGSNSGEAIIFNGETQKYDFKLVEKAASGNSFVLKDSPAGLCVKCHQGEGPIFPAGTWFETEVGFADEYHLDRKQIGLAIAKANTLDKSIRVSNEVWQSKRVCQKICNNEDLSCRTDLLLMELQIQSGEHPVTPPSLSQWISALPPTEDFSHVSSVLPSHGLFDRFPNTISTQIFYFQKDQTHQDYTCSLKDLNDLANQGQLDYDEPTAFDPHGLQVKSLLCPNLGEGSPVSPLFKRPKVGALNANLILSEFPRIVSHCFGITQDAIETSKKLGLSQITQNLSRPDCKKKLFRGETLGVDSESLNEIIKGNCEAVRNEAGKDQDLKPRTDLLSVPLLKHTLLQSNPTFRATHLEKQQALQLFKTSCVKCHGSDAILELKIDWSNLSSIKTYIGTNGVKVYDKVSSRAMPFDQRLSDADKNLLEKVLLAQ